MDKYFRIDNGEFIKFYDNDTIGAVSLEKVEDFIPITLRENVILSNYYIYTNVLEKICIIRHISDPYRFYITPFFEDLETIRLYTYALVNGILHSNDGIYFTYIYENRFKLTESLVKLINIPVIEVVKKSENVYESERHIYDFTKSNKITSDNVVIKNMQMSDTYAICYECNDFNHMITYDEVQWLIYDLIAILTINEYLNNSDNVDAPAYIDVLWTNVGKNVEDFYVIEDAGHDYIRIPKIHMLLKNVDGVSVVVGDLLVNEKRVHTICREVFNDLEESFNKYKNRWDESLFNRDFNDILSTVNVCLYSFSEMFVYRKYN